MANREELNVDQLFALFRTSGRPGRLAELFDRTAPELLRVAMHLTDDPERAEDLVQATYLEAMAAARRFEPGRRVLPWLLGILHNLAREARRDAHRRSRPAGPRPAPVADPAAAASHGELTRAVDEAIETLPEVYRPILVLHLQHGFGPAEIAHVLRRSPGTIRSQLARGLKQLRAALPAGFASTVALSLRAGRGLAAVRRAVVWQAVWALPRLWLAQMGSAVAAPKPIVVATVVAASFAVISSLGWLGRDRGAEGAAAPLTGAGAIRAAAAGKQLASSPASSHRRPVAPVSGRALDPRPATLIVRVESPRPGDRVGVLVMARPLALGDGLLAERRCRTDAQGIAAFSELPAGPVQVRLDRRGGPRLELEPGGRVAASVDLGSGLVVRGRVVDERGTPVPGAGVWVAEGGHADMGAIATQADAHGHFRLAGLAPGHLLAARADDYQMKAPVLPPADGAMDLVVGAASATVRGRVTDPDGRPVPGALVRVGTERPPFYLLDPDGGPQRLVTNRPPVTAITDERGEYSVRSATPSPGLRVFARATGRVGASAVAAVAAGATATRDFVLREGCVAHGCVSFRGQPLPGVSVIAHPPSPGLPEWWAAAATTDASGDYWLTGVAPGDVELHLRAAARGVTQRSFAATAGAEHRWDVEWSESPALAGVLSGPDGLPCAGAVVRLEGSGAWHSTTDAHGVFEFVALDDEAHRVLVQVPGAAVPVWLVAREGLRLPVDDLRLGLAATEIPTARLRGVVRAPDGSPAAGATVRLRHDANPEWAEFAADASGRWHVEPLTPGRYYMRVVADDLPALDPGPFDLPPRGNVDLGVLESQRGARVGLRLLVASHPSAERVQVAVHSAAGARVYFRDLVAWDHRTPPLPSGRYRVAVWGHAVPLLSRLVDVPETGQVDVELAVVPSLLQRVRVEATDPAVLPPGVNMRVEWVHEASQAVATQDLWLRRGGPTVAEQRLVPGRYTVRVRTSGGATAERVVAVGDDPGTVVLRVGR
ncbi:MAG: sigma-70 family RNA polymerase sigma factor [Planctomycetota bacterium]